VRPAGQREGGLSRAVVADRIEAEVEQRVGRHDRGGGAGAMKHHRDQPLEQHFLQRVRCVEDPGVVQLALRRLAGSDTDAFDVDQPRLSVHRKDRRAAVERCAVAAPHLVADGDRRIRLRLLRLWLGDDRAVRHQPVVDFAVAPAVEGEVVPQEVVPREHHARPGHPVKLFLLQRLLDEVADAGEDGAGRKGRENHNAITIIMRCAGPVILSREDGEG